MEFKRGQVVLAKCGREQGRLLAVEKVSETRVFICDGKERPLEKPKAKNTRHLQKTNLTLDSDAMASNRKLKKALAELMRK